MKKTAFLMLLPFLASIAACSSSGGMNENNSDGGTPSTNANVTCPEKCAHDSSRDSACTSTSHVGSRYACACEDTFAPFTDLDCSTDLGQSTAKSGLCCNASPVAHPAGGACDSARDCAEITCTCGEMKGAKSFACINGVCADEKTQCGC